MRRVSATESPPNFSSTASASTSATIASATTAAAGTAHTSERWWCATAASPVATSTVRSARGTVAIGFIAARTRSSSPVDMPPSVPPRDRDVRRGAVRARLDLVVRRRARPAGQVEAVADLDALDRLDAHQRAGQPGVEPAVPVHVRAEAGRERRTPTTSTTPPSVSPSLWAWSISATIAALASASRQRTGSASRRATSSGVGTTPYGASASRSRRRGDQPDADRLLEEGRGHRAERDPGGGLAGAGPLEHRSGLVEAVLLHADQVGVPGPRPGQRGVARQSLERSPASTGSADITCSHFGHSVLPIVIATGPPMRAAVPDAAEDRHLVLLELHPGTAAVAEPAARQHVDDVLRGDLHAGRQPSRTATRAGPCDSPAVSQRSMAPSLSRGAAADRSASERTSPRTGCPASDADQRADQHERPERVALAVDHLRQREHATDDAAEQEAGVHPDEHLAPAEVAEGEPEQSGQPDVAVAETARVDDPQQEVEAAVGQPAETRRAPGRRCPRRAPRPARSATISTAYDGAMIRVGSSRVCASM